MLPAIFKPNCMIMVRTFGPGPVFLKNEISFSLLRHVAPSFCCLSSTTTNKTKRLEYQAISLGKDDSFMQVSTTNSLIVPKESLIFFLHNITPRIFHLMPTGTPEQAKRFVVSADASKGNGFKKGFN